MAVDGGMVKAVGWPELEAAVACRDWATASKLARALEREWLMIRGFVEAFGTLGSWSHAIDEEMGRLLAALEARPVDLAILARAMAWFRRFAP